MKGKGQDASKSRGCRGRWRMQGKVEDVCEGGGCREMERM